MACTRVELPGAEKGDVNRVIEAGAVFSVAAEDAAHLVAAQAAVPDQGDEG